MFVERRKHWCSCRSRPLLLLAATGLAIAGCGGNANKKAEAAFAHQHVYTTTPGAAAATLARLTVPEGFKRTGRCSAPESVCFARARSIVVNGAEFTRMVSLLGAAATPTTAGCTRARRPAVPRLALLACSARATAGGDLLHVTLTSVVLATRTAARSSTRSLPGGMTGSTIEVTDIGH